MSETKETMLTYIQESAQVIARNASRSKELTAPLVAEYLKKDYKTIWIVASGSSANGSFCARHFIRKYLRTEVKIITPFTFEHLENDFNDDDFIFVVSQSGYSTNAIAALQVIKAKGRRTIGICADLESDMKDHCDLLVDYGIGYEKVHYVTLGVTGFALFMMLFTIEAAVAKDLMSEKLATSLKAEITEAATVHQTVQQQVKTFYQTNFLDLTSMTTVFIGGVGPGQGIAMEGALKISETFQIPVLALEVEEYLHGITLQVNPNTTMFFIDVGIASKRVQEIYNANKVATRKSFLLTNSPAFKDDPQAVSVNTAISPEVLPLCYLPFFQYIAHQVTDDCHKWHKHPVHELLNKMVAAKTANYDISKSIKDQ